MAEDNREPLAGASALREALWALLPPTKEELVPELGEKVEPGVARLLREAAELFCGGRRSECLQASEAVLDYSWEKLNTGPWRDVHKDWRRVYAFGCLLKAACLCDEPGNAPAVAEALRVCDMGLLMGAAIHGDVLLKVAAVLQAHLRSGKRPGAAQEQPSTKKARNDGVSVPDVASERPVPRLRCPSLQHFRKQFLAPGRPVILEGVVDQWPCMTKWSLEYLQEIAGCRTVPVEVGSRYTDEDWSQTLMTVNEFISKYLRDEVRRRAASPQRCPGVPALQDEDLEGLVGGQSCTLTHFRCFFFPLVQFSGGLLFFFFLIVFVRFCSHRHEFQNILITPPRDGVAMSVTSSSALPAPQTTANLPCVSVDFPMLDLA